MPARSRMLEGGRSGSLALVIVTIIVMAFLVLFICFMERPPGADPHPKRQTARPDQQERPHLPLKVNTSA